MHDVNRIIDEMMCSGVERSYAHQLVGEVYAGFVTSLHYRNYEKPVHWTAKQHELFDAIQRVYMLVV